MKRHEINVIYKYKENIDSLIEQKLNHLAQKKSEDNNGERTLTFSYASSKEANMSRFLVKKVPKEVKLRIERV